MKKLIYGGTVLFCEPCPECGDDVLCGTTDFHCPDCHIDFSKNVKKKDSTEIIISNQKRKPIPKSIKKELIVKQDGRCYWCGRLFGTPYIKNNRVGMLSSCGDHKIPYSYIKSNPNNNWVLACNICNGKKSNKMYDTEEEIKNYLLKEWDKYFSSGKIQL